MSYLRPVNPNIYMNNQISANSILVKKISITRTNKGHIKGNIEGETDMCLPATYFDTLAGELSTLFELYLNRLYAMNRKGDCTITIEVKSNGTFNWENIHLKLNCETGIGISPVDYFNRPLNAILPFATAIKNVTFFGRKNKISYLIADIHMNRDYFSSVLTTPTLNQTLKADWLRHCKDIWERARKEHQYDLVVPCHDGNLSLDTKSSVLYFFVENDQRTKLS